MTHLSDIPRGPWVFRNPAIKSFFVFVPFYLARLGFFRFVQYRYAPGPLYMYHLLVDFVGVFFILTVAAFFLNRSARDKKPLEQYLGYVTFFGVILFLTTVLDAILGEPYWTLYRAALRPLLWGALFVLVPMSVVVADTATGGGWAVLFILIAPFVGAVPAMFSEWLLPGVAVVSTIGVLLLVAGAVYWELYRTGRVQEAPTVSKDDVPS